MLEALIPEGLNSCWRGAYIRGACNGMDLLLPVIELILAEGAYEWEGVLQATVYGICEQRNSCFRPLSKRPRRKPPLICLQLFLGPIEFHGPYVLIFREALRIPRK